MMFDVVLLYGHYLLQTWPNLWVQVQLLAKLTLRSWHGSNKKDGARFGKVLINIDHISSYEPKKKVVDLQ